MIEIKYRNANVLRAGIAESIIAVALLAINIVSSFRLGELGIGALAFVAGSALYHLASWYSAVLEVGSKGVTVSDVFVRRELAWDAVAAFEIRAPGRRSPLMLLAHPWADQAKVRLTSGRRLQVRAIEPYHGSGAPTLFALRSTTKADEWIAALNLLRSESVEHAGAKRLAHV